MERGIHLACVSFFAPMCIQQKRGQLINTEGHRDCLDQRFRPSFELVLIIHWVVGGSFPSCTPDVFVFPDQSEGWNATKSPLEQQQQQQQQLSQV